MIALLITTVFIVAFTMGVAVGYLYSPIDYPDHHHHHNKRKPIAKTKKATKVY
jgi:hypothetical protein